MKWHISIARYNKKLNAVAERRVKNFANSKEGLEYLNKNADKPIYLWHDDAPMLNNPYFAMVETDAYKLEHKKEIH